MGLKSIEMQVALPRVVDAAKIQEHELNRGTHTAENMAASVAKEEEKAKKQMSEWDKKDEGEIKDQDSKHSHENKQQNKDQPKSKDEHPNVIMSHPYKGKRIDFKS